MEGNKKKSKYDKSLLTQTSTIHKMVSAKIKDNTAIYVLLHHKKRKSNCNFFASLVSKTAFRLTEQPPMETKLRGKTHQNIQIHRS